MKREETRKVIATYCDYCGKELKYGHSSVKYENGTELDFCNEHTDKISKTCWDNFHELGLPFPAVPPSEEKKEEAKELDLSCDVCGKHPACIFETQFGRYCMKHARLV